MLLTPQERDRFVIWLTQNADSTDQIVKQMEKISGDPVIGALVKRQRAEATACRIVSAKLESMQFDSISGRADRE